MHSAFVNSIGTALPPHEAHQTFLSWAQKQVECERERALFRRMAQRSGIEQRWSVLPPAPGSDQTGPGAFYDGGIMPATSRRMAVYHKEAPELCLEAVAELGSLGDVTHLVVASCTGFVAPGIDQIIAGRLGLSPSLERTLIGFMGCYAAVVALRTARHIVRSEPDARVLVLTTELCTLHLQSDRRVDQLLTMLLFGDGTAAALVSAEPRGIEITEGFSAALPQSDELIGWTIGDTGFAMTLSGAVPARIAEAIADGAFAGSIGEASKVDSWAVHAGGRTVLDAVERGFDLPEHALAHSRDVLRECGNMSSATLMFVLARILDEGGSRENGIALAFGPGLAAEGLRYRMAR